MYVQPASSTTTGARWLFGRGRPARSTTTLSTSLAASGPRRPTSDERILLVDATTVAVDVRLAPAASSPREVRRQLPQSAQVIQERVVATDVHEYFYCARRVVRHHRVPSD